MNDDWPPPPLLYEPDDDPQGYELLERDLRALFAPVPAPRAWRERLKAELLQRAEPFAFVEPAAPRGQLPAPLKALAAHPRAVALITTGLAAAAAITIALHGFGVAVQAPLPALPPTRTPAPTHTAMPRPTATVAPAVAPTAVPTVAPIAAPTVAPTAVPTVAPARAPRAVRAPSAHTVPHPPQGRPSPTATNRPPTRTARLKPVTARSGRSGTATRPSGPSGPSGHTRTAVRAPAPGAHHAGPPIATLAPPVTATPERLQAVSPPTAQSSPTSAPQATEQSSPTTATAPRATAQGSPTAVVRATAQSSPTVAPPASRTPTPATRPAGATSVRAVPPAPRPHPPRQRVAPPARPTAATLSAGATATPQHRAAHAGATPRLSLRDLGIHVHIGLPPTAAPQPSPTPQAATIVTVQPAPTATALPSATATPRASATPRVMATTPPSATAELPTAAPTATATAAPPATATATAVPSATATATSNPVLVPLAQPGLPVPGTTNGLLGSPLDGALVGAQQPMSYSIPPTLTLQRPAPLTLISTTPTLPVYKLTPSVPTLADLFGLAVLIGAAGPLTPTQPGVDGSVAATVQIDSVPYTLTVYSGYGTPSFSLQSVAPGVGHSTGLHLVTEADTWLRTHHLLRDLRLLAAQDGNVSYGQSIAGAPLLGVAAQLTLDGSGTLRALRYDYVAPRAVTLQPALSPALAADAVVDFNQGLYRGPDTTTITGTSAITGMELAYVGVHGATGDYMEPIYALEGTAPTTAGPQPFSLYVPALQFRVGSRQ